MAFPSRGRGWLLAKSAMGLGSFALITACEPLGGEIVEDDAGTTEGGATLKTADAGGLPETPDVAPFDGWLEQVNFYRRTAGLQQIGDDPAYSAAAVAHAKYIVRTDRVEHGESKDSPYYTKEGAESAGFSNVLGTENKADRAFSIDTFMRTPFHTLQVLHPQLRLGGYGEFYEDGPGLRYSAVLNVLQGLAEKAPVYDRYPIRFPEADRTVPLRDMMAEYPDPLSACPGFTGTVGLPILVQYGPTLPKPIVTTHAVLDGNKPVDHCVFTAATYVNPNVEAQKLARELLAAAGAVVIIPRSALKPKTTYEVKLAVEHGAFMDWSFRVANNAR